MDRIILTLALVTMAAGASAQSCPDFYRFVDFGLRDADRRFLRGGPLYRAESLAGTPLSDESKTQCRAVSDIAFDGHANPIPVVARIQYAIEKIPFELDELQVSFAEDTSAAASRNSARHRVRLATNGSKQIKNQNSLCVTVKDDPMISCQVFSPYPGNVDLVIYCDEAQCKMPVLAVTPNIQISASWSIGGSIVARPVDASEGILAKVQSIYEFLEPLASGI